MSLKKQIQRNIARQEDKLLKPYAGRLGPELSPQERGLLAKMVRNGITPMDLENAVREGRRSAYRDTAPAVHGALYNALCIVAHDEFGFDEDKCFALLLALDRKIADSLDNDELAQECEEKCGIRIHTKEGVGRVERIGKGGGTA